MIQPISIVEGMIQPKQQFNKIYHSEIATGFGWRLALLIFASGIMNALFMYMGMGSEELMSQMDQVIASKLEWAKIVWSIGAIFGGFLYPIFLMLFFSGLFWFFYKEVGFTSLLNLQLYIIPIFLLENLSRYIIYLSFGIDKTYSPFGFGPLIHQLVNHDFLIYFFSSITFFNIWVIMIQCIALKINTNRSFSKLILIVISTHLFLGLLSAIIATVFEKIQITL